MDEQLFLLPQGDNGGRDERDRDFGGIGDFLDRFPILDTPTKNYSQYTKTEYTSACTIFSGINACAMLRDYDFSAEEIEDIIQFAVQNGYVIGQGWVRSTGWMTVLKRRNKKFPDKLMSMFAITLFSEEFEKLSSRRIPVGVSINVNSGYWADVRVDLKLDKAPYATGTGHATNCRNGLYCVDSVPQMKATYNDLATPMVYTRTSKELMEKLKEGGNLRGDASVFVKNERLKPDNANEIVRLQQWETRLIKDIKNLQTVIENNSRYWENTTVQSERDKRHEFNEALRSQLAYNQSKLKVVQECLSKL